MLMWALFLDLPILFNNGLEHFLLNLVFWHAWLTNSKGQFYCLIAKLQLSIINGSPINRSTTIYNQFWFEKSPNQDKQNKPLRWSTRRLFNVVEKYIITHQSMMTHTFKYKAYNKVDLPNLREYLNQFCHGMKRHSSPSVSFFLLLLYKKTRKCYRKR